MNTPERLQKIALLGFAALLTAMVIFAGVAEVITRYALAGDRNSSLPLVAFVPALLVAAVLAFIGWRTARWRRFAVVQLIVFAAIFAVLLLVFGP